MKISVSLSKKQNEQGKCSALLLIRRRSSVGKVVDVRAKVALEFDPSKFNKECNTFDKYRNGKINPDKTYHNKNVDKLGSLLIHISERYEALTIKDDANSLWLQQVVDDFLFPEKRQEEERRRKNLGIYGAMMLYYESKNDVSVYYKKWLLVVFRSVARYEQYVRLTTNKGFVFGLNNVSKEVIEDFRDYLLHEYELANEHPKLFEKITNNYPFEIPCRNKQINPKGSNAVFKILKSLKAFFLWAARNELTDNNPFEKTKLSDVIDGEKYAAPWFLSKEERNKIETAPMPTKALEVQRDIFVFQCLIGCRVFDLAKLTPSNIDENGVLHYIPHKTKDNNQKAMEARIPLNEKALALVGKYEGVDVKGRLFPFISDQKYNEAIKKVLTVADITRMVSVRNSISGEIELRPINEVGSSHLARRTFVGNLYNEVADPNLIGKMSGHVEGSQAFGRYRTIGDDILRKTLANL